MVLHLKRGFHRVAWLLVLLASPVVAFFSYEWSNGAVSYEPVEVEFRPTAPDANDVVLQNVGIMYVPDGVPSKAVDAARQVLKKRPRLPPPIYLDENGERRPKETPAQFFTRITKRFPDLAKEDPTLVAKFILVRYREYGESVHFQEFELKPKYGKSLPRAFAFFFAIMVGLAATLHFLIFSVGWAVRGFSPAAERDDLL